MQRLLAVLLVLIGLIGLALGRLGETTWAPETKTTATVDLSAAGPAVVIDPGVLYVGGEEGQVVIEGGSDISVITAANGDIDAYLEGVRYTRITGASDWTTLSTQEVNPDGAAELADPTGSDLWRTVDTEPSPYTLDVADFWAAENGENEQVYREILIVSDGTAPAAESVSITWPVDAKNEWVPFAYAGGAAIAVIGLVLLVVSLGGGRRRDEDEDEGDELAGISHGTAESAGSAAAFGSGATAATEPDADTTTDADTATGADTNTATSTGADTDTATSTSTGADTDTDTVPVVDDDAPAADEDRR